jgi:hypothetical protein
MAGTSRRVPALGRQGHRLDARLPVPLLRLRSRRAVGNAQPQRDGCRRLLPRGFHSCMVQPMSGKSRKAPPASGNRQALHQRRGGPPRDAIRRGVRRTGRSRAGVRRVGCQGDGEVGAPGRRPGTLVPVVRQPKTSPKVLALRKMAAGAKRHSSTAASVVIEDRNAGSAASCRILCRPSTMSCRATCFFGSASAKVFAEH